MYGIWLRGRGWMRGNRKDDSGTEMIVSFSDREFAVEVAGIIGARARRVDESWKELETFYLEQESRTLWTNIKKLFMANLKKSKQGSIKTVK